MGERINIQNLVDLFSEKKGLSKKDAETFLKEMFVLIEQALETDKYVKIKGFGTFKLIEVDSRESVNVNTGERIEIQGHTKISFAPENGIRDQINKPFSHFETVILNEDTVFDDMSAVEDGSETENDSATSSETEEVTYSNDETIEKTEAAQLTGEPVEVPVIEQKKEDSSVENDEVINDKPQTVFEPKVIFEPQTTASEPQADSESQITSEPQVVSEFHEASVQNTNVQNTNPVNEEVIPSRNDEKRVADEIPVVAKTIESSGYEETKVKDEKATSSKVQEIITQKTLSHEAGTDRKNLIQESAESLAVAPTIKSEKEALIEELILAAKTGKTNSKASSSANRSIVFYFVGMIVLLAFFAVAVFTYINNPDFIMSMLPASTEENKADSTMVDSIPAANDAISMADTVTLTNRKEIEKDTSAVETKEIKAKIKEVTSDKIKSETKTDKAKADKSKADKVEKLAISKEQTSEKKKQDISNSKEQKLEKLNPSDYKIVGTKTTYTVQKGESLVKISKRYYNSKDLWTLIVKHNPKAIDNPDYVPAGTVIKIPELRSKL